MYTIGEFSRVTNVTVKALRHYHSKGVLQPSYVSKHTSYRYYSDADIEKLRIVTVLKLMDFDLTSIKHMLIELGDEADLTTILADRQSIIAGKIQRLNQASSAIDQILTKEREAAKMSINIGEIIIKELPDVGVVTSAWQGTYQDTGKAMGKVYRAAGRHASGPAFNLYHDGEYKEIAEVETCLPVKRQLDSSCEYKVLPGATFATLVHVGPYETLGDSYAKLFEFINANQKTSGVPIREVYHKGPGMLLKGNPKKYVTEIQIPI